jgi:HSP20 family molecular chaperone IbpA
MNRDDFDLSVENNVITLRGERHFEKKDETDNYHQVERLMAASSLVHTAQHGFCRRRNR